MLFFLPALLVLGAYAIGAIPFSFLVVRMFSGEDIREFGSGNVGATNVLRSFGRAPGAIALVLDVAKGWGAVKLAGWIVSRPQWPFPPLPANGAIYTPAFWVGLAALFAVLGHMLPVWLCFRGGKGVATAAGVYLALDPLSIAMALVLFFLVIVFSRYVSLASILAACAVPPLMRFLTHQGFWYVMFSIIIALAVIFRHRQNIIRLAAGTERTLGESEKSE
ncbi:MAG: glycerol-3-phosphate 1-O-acyltransferase PlsY [Acidobacteriota bacterium]